MSKFEYLRLADTVAAQIASGGLKPGDRLPPQRSFAYERKIAVSTASRVYTELLRRGLVVGEVGRGTFISGEARRGIAAQAEPRGARIDFEFNYPLLPTQAAMVAKSLEALQRPEALESALRQATSTGTQSARNTSADYLAHDGWTPGSEQIVFTANGRQSIAATLAAVVPPGGRCGVEALTYPFIKGIAARLGVTLVPLAMDEHGVRPDAVQKAHREAHLSALYVQPIIQNPLGITMPAARRTDLLRVVEKLDLTIIEDNVYAFLDDEPPLAVLAPDRCIVLDSLSKKVAPGLALGFIVAPPRLRENVIASVRSGGWTASGYAFAAAQRLMGDGTAAELARLKRIDAVTAPADRRQMPRRIRNPDQLPVLSSVADAAAALAVADLRRRRGTPRHRVDAVDDVCGNPRTCAERGTAGAGRAPNRSARCQLAGAGRHPERQRRGFRGDRIDRRNPLALTRPAIPR